ncbi:MAG: FtsH protease activity modulator HflK [Lachnospiraceae bacterium]|nr:FtsH protease activity modulator HflK [Lachnospiraceae bacterium]MEE1014845.1 FtsH protease activity modulator HflK [Lachnospiraceae bacterium]
MFKKRMFHQRNTTQTAQDAEFVQSTPKQPINIGKGLKIVPIFFLVMLIVFTLFQSVYSLEEDEYAVIQTWGYVQVEETPGIKFKIPYIQQVHKVSKASKQFSVGYDIDTNESIHRESFMITNDYNFVNVDFYFEYQITDPVKYFYASEEPEVIVKNLAQSYIRDTVGTHSVDEVLTTGKYEIQSEIKTLLQERLEKEDIGIQITNAVIQDAEVPTTEVAQAFKNVEDAKQGMETAINNANADANTRIPAANAEADKIVKDAQAEKEALIAEAEGQVARFNSLYEEYIKFPLITKQRMFYETMEEVLPSMNIYITDGSTQTMLPLEPFSQLEVNNSTNGGE